ncbi:MAG: adenylate/guanylate cyclase domain-containing protein [Microthrixaceae bacterium]
MISSLPTRRTALVGRDADVADVVALLATSRLVTLLGVGGVGKTSLALEVARQSEADFEVHLVDLASSGSDASVDASVADQLGLVATPEVAPLDALVGYFGANSHLLLLDNCEHVLDQAAALVDELLDRCDGLRLLATSRARLVVDGERARPVSPLDIGEAADGPSPAADLFIQRALAAGATVDSADPQVAELVRRLDGVPLAIELAAARLATVPLSSLLDQLGDRLAALGGGARRGDQRHQSLKSVLEWSVDLLDEVTTQGLADLSVFVGGFTEEAARSVAGPEAAGAVADLVAASLLEWDETASGPRYRMLEMIRSFGSDLLVARGALTDVGRRHARYFATWVLVAQRELRGPREAEWVQRFRAELANLGTAFAWAARNGATELVSDLACGLGDHVYSRSGREEHTWIADAVATMQEPFAIEELTVLAAISAQRRGDLEELERLLAIAAEHDHRGLRFIQGTESSRGVLAIFQGRPADADAHFARAIEQSAEPAPAMMSTGFRGLARSYSGDHEQGRALAARFSAAAERLGWPTGLSGAAYVEAEVLIGIDRPAALRAYRRCADLAASVDNRFLAGVNMISWASAEVRFGEPSDAFELFGAALDHFASNATWSYQSILVRNLAELLVRVELHEEAYMMREAVSRLSGSAELSGADLDRDSYITALLNDRLVPKRRHELDNRAAEETRESLLEFARKVVASAQARDRAKHPIQAVVFTDLEGATAFMADLGDREAREVMRHYEVLTNRLIESHRGRRVKGTGDGMLLLFPSISASLRCLAELQREVAADPGRYPLRMRAGVHAGELIDELGDGDGDDIHGTVVNLTARVVDQAGGGQIVLSETARQIVVGADLEFVALGPVELKGIGNPVALYRYDWAYSESSARPQG